MRKLNKQLSQIRDKLLINLWEKKKANLTMKDVGSIFGLGTTTTWHILKRRDDYRYIRKAYNKLLRGKVAKPKVVKLKVE